MDAQASTFTIEDAFNITGRGLVLIGSVCGEVDTGQQLLLANGSRWLIRGINYVNRANWDERFGLLVAAPITSRQELVAAGIIGSTVSILTSPDA